MVPLLFLVGVLSGESGSVVESLIRALGAAIVGIAVILVAGKFLVRPLFAFVAAARSVEVFVAATLLMVIATATLSHAAGLSAALGAFLAGLVLAETEFRHELEVNIAPVKGLLLGLFFMSVGMGIDLAAVLEAPLLLGMSVLGLLSIKAVIAAAIVRFHGFRRSEALEIGLTLAQGGEFAFVVVGLALHGQLLDSSTAQFMLIVVSVTMLLTPPLTRFAHYSGRALAAREDKIGRAHV